MTWRKLTIDGLAPPPRGGHAVAACGSTLLLFGGADRSPQAYDDLWQLELGNGGTAQWTRITSSFPPSVSCAARSGAVLVPVGDKVYLFGGQEPNTGICFNDVLELDPASWTWSQLQVQGARPPARHSCVAVAFKEQCLLVFGGAGQHGQLADVWLFNCQQRNWSCPHITCRGGQLPAAREMAAGVMMNPDELLVFGGRSAESRVLDEVLVLNTRDDWTWSSSSTTQLPRCAHTLVALPLSSLQPPQQEERQQQHKAQQAAGLQQQQQAPRQQLLVFGGFSGTAVEGSLWALQHVDDQQHASSGSSSSSAVAGGWAVKQLGQTCSANEATCSSGTSGSGSSGDPVPRFAHAAACLPSPEGGAAPCQVMVVVGGVNPADDLMDVVVWSAE